MVGTGEAPLQGPYSSTEHIAGHVERRGEDQ